ncbi:MAG: amidohydrolase [Actinomycetia bacterium]|nr:amidohydrolase [Actinomycetes bacterium]
MLPKSAKVISVDDHIVEHPHVWSDRLPAAMQDAGPRVVYNDQGVQQWLFEGAPAGNLALNAVAGKDPTELGMDPVTFDEMRPGCFDPKVRLDDMDTDGVWGQANFPNFPGFAGTVLSLAKDKALAVECVKAYNDFVLDEWCPAAPDRFIPIVLTPFWDVEESAKEVRRTAAKGARAISFVETPHTLGLPSWHSDHWDPLLAEAEAAEMPLCLHFGSGGAPTVAADANLVVLIALFGMNSIATTVDLLLSPVFHKFPSLKVALSEGGIGWMPYAIERVDSSWERHRWYNDVNRDVRPSELFAEHIFGCFIQDEAGIEARHRIGVGNIMFESDYPHSDSMWPNSRARLEASLASVPDDEAVMIAETNARRLFRFPA